MALKKRTLCLNCFHEDGLAVDMNKADNEPINSIYAHQCPRCGLYTPLELTDKSIVDSSLKEWDGQNPIFKPEPKTRKICYQCSGDKIATDMPDNDICPRCGYGLIIDVSPDWIKAKKLVEWDGKNSLIPAIMYNIQKEINVPLRGARRGLRV